MSHSYSPDVMHEQRPDEETQGAIFDLELATHLIGLELAFLEDGNWQTGKVVSYDVCTANDNAVLHLVHWDRPHVPDEHNLDHYSFEHLIPFHTNLITLRATTSPLPTPVHKQL